MSQVRLPEPEACCQWKPVMHAHQAVIAFCVHGCLPGLGMVAVQQTVMASSSQQRVYR